MGKTTKKSLNHNDLFCGSKYLKILTFILDYNQYLDFYYRLQGVSTEDDFYSRLQPVSIEEDFYSRLQTISIEDDFYSRLQTVSTEDDYYHLA